jgi:hypothetical protein
VKSNSILQPALKVGFTSILLGYFLVWLPHDAAGLSFIGLEMGEWTKFLPNVQQGQYPADRIFFYIPPITLGLLLVAWTMDWSNRRWKTRMMRGVAVLVSLLAFPSLESIRFESTDQWLPRLLLVMVVLVSAILCGQANRLSKRMIDIIQSASFAFLGLLGAILPMWSFLVLRPEIASIFGASTGVGLGLWLNTAGHLIIAGVGGYGLYTFSRERTGESITA